MSASRAPQLLSRLNSSICAACRSRLPFFSARPFSTAPQWRAAAPPSTTAATNQSEQKPRNPIDSFLDLLERDRPEFNRMTSLGRAEGESNHHLHVYATKHNTHITLTKPNHEPLLSVACGNIGFRKSGRGSYDSAYQLAAFVMGKIQDMGLLREIRSIELVLRGFGPGREAVTKVLLGSEGRNLKGKITKVKDATRLKFGGTRSPARRRLG